LKKRNLFSHPVKLRVISTTFDLSIEYVCKEILIHKRNQPINIFPTVLYECGNKTVINVKISVVDPDPVPTSIIEITLRHNFNIIDFKQIKLLNNIRKS